MPGNSTSTPNSDISKMKFAPKFNWGGLLKSAPSVIGHVVQIGTTIASVFDVQDGDGPTVATNTMKTSAVDSKSGFYQLILHDVGEDMKGIAVACYDAAGASQDPLLAKYVIPFVKWAKKVI